MGFKGSNFTWCNMHQGDDLIYERLDRGLVDVEWLQLFPHARIEHFSVVTSDHMGLLLKIDHHIGKTKLVRRFEFEPG